jgi:N-acetyl-anhydromuramyl-L-alanine amidase AmpD
MDVASMFASMMGGPALGFLIDFARKAGAPIAEMGSADEIDAQPAPELDAPTLVAAALPGVAINRARFRLAPGQFIAQPQKKTAVVLHFTAGPTAAGAFNSWVADARTVATAYIVDFDGTVYECFDPRYWAGHIGSSGYANEKRTIGIEIAGWGPLKKQGTNLCAWPGNWTRRVFSLEDTDRYVQKTFRGIHYFTRYPEAQMTAVCALTRHLCERFDIPRDVPATGRRLVADKPYFSGFKGVFSHENLRSDKWDTGPALDWERLAGAIR